MPQTIDNMSATWANSLTTFSFFKANVTDTASAAGSLLMDLQVGGTSRFKVDKTGGIVSSLNAYGTGSNTLKGSLLGLNLHNTVAYFQTSSNIGLSLTVSGSAGNIMVSSTGSYMFSSGVPGASGEDTILSRRAAANLRLGAPDAAAPVAQTLSVQSVVAGTTNTAGANLTITGSQGTGTGAGGSIIFQVAPAGSSGTAQNALATALTIDGTGTNATFAQRASFGASNIFIERESSVRMQISVGGNAFGFTNSSFTIATAGSIGFRSADAVTNSLDVSLFRDAANTLALRNGANAQTFRVYNTWTSFGTGTEIWERGKFAWESNVLTIGTEKGANGGTARALEFQTDGTTRLTIADTTNTITLPAASTLNCGTSSVVRMRYINDPTNAISFFDFHSTAGAAVFAVAAPNPRLQFGGTTSSFPAIKRDATKLVMRLADDSANAALESASLKTDAPTGGTSGTWKLGTRVAATTTLDTTQYIEVDVGGTLYKLAVVTS